MLFSEKNIRDTFDVPTLEAAELLLEQGKPGHVLYDIKHLFPVGQVDARL